MSNQSHSNLENLKQKIGKDNLTNVKVFFACELERLTNAILDASTDDEALQLRKTAQNYKKTIRDIECLINPSQNLQKTTTFP